MNSFGVRGEKPSNSRSRCHLFLSEFLNVAFRGFSRTSHAASIADRHYPIRKFTGLKSSPKETIMREWLKPEITESEAGMEVTSYLPAELDRA
jgi:coenzyme PQQ precursor peptide PqqA